MFSPYYARARRRGVARAEDHCALNVCLYGPRASGWAMTERGHAALRRGPHSLVIGPSSLDWDGRTLSFEIDEVTVPWPARLRGQVRVQPRALATHVARLDAAGAHRWCPLAPSARVEVDLHSPSLRWRGNAYCDHNHGDEPLEARLRSWNWSRSDTRGGSAVLYDVLERSGQTTSLALAFDTHAQATPFAPPAGVTLPRSGWRIARATRSEDGRAQVERTLEDTPFYARSVVRSQLLGEANTAVHESLDLDRFDSRIVQAMLPFRMPRRSR